MNMLTSRRRGYCKKVDRIMTNKTNSPVLSICKAQNWCASSKYMTATEATAVTDIGAVFKNNTSITHFEELQYFTSITSIATQAFYGCTSLQNVILPPNITSIGSEAFRNSLKGNYELVIPEGVLTIGASAFYSTKIGKYLILPSTITTLGDSAFRNSSFRLLYIPPSCTTIGGNYTFAGTPSGANRIAVINRNTMPAPTSNNPYIFQTGSTPKWRFYVPVGRTGSFPIKDGATYIYKSYIQSVSEIPSTFDTSSRQSIINSLDALDASA